MMLSNHHRAKSCFFHLVYDTRKINPVRKFSTTVTSSSGRNSKDVTPLPLTVQQKGKSAGEKKEAQNNVNKRGRNKRQLQEPRGKKQHARQRRQCALEKQWKLKNGDTAEGISMCGSRSIIHREDEGVDSPFRVLS
jgi:hypothetical protein